MNFVRVVAPALMLTLASAAACKTDRPDGTSNPPGEGGNAAPTDGEDPVEGSTAAKPEGSGEEGGESEGTEPTPAAPTCEAKVADTPTPLFGDKVLIRPPVNVELVEDNPTFATTYASGGFVSACDATVDRMSVFVFKNDKKKKLTKYTEEVVNDMLPKNGFTGGTRGENTIESDTDVHTSMEYPASNGAPAAKLYIAVTRKLGYVLVVIYQTRPPEFPVLEPSFKASAQSLLVVPS